MNIKKIFLLVLFFFSVCFLTPKTSKAVDLQQVFTSEDSIVLKIQEGIEYFFAFRIENKIAVLEKQAEKRLTMAQNYTEEGNNEKVQGVLYNYAEIKERQNHLLTEIGDGKVLGIVAERTIEQQKTMEKIKTKVGEDGKQNVIQIQEQVVNRVAQRVVEVNGTEGQTEFLNKVEHVWAPGTGPGGTSGVIYEGGSKLMFAPGTTSGGSATNDIKTVEIKTGGTINEPVPAGGNMNTSPNTVQGNPGNTIDPGTIDPGNGDKWVIDP
jgi:hypothetical protein